MCRVPAYLQGFETFVNRVGRPLWTGFQHTYKGSKHPGSMRVVSQETGSSIPTRVRNKRPEKYSRNFYQVPAYLQGFETIILIVRRHSLRHVPAYLQGFETGVGFRVLRGPPLFQHTYKGSKQEWVEYIDDQSRVPAYLQGFETLQSTSWACSPRRVPAYLQGFETPPYIDGNSGFSEFQHTYKGSKPVHPETELVILDCVPAYLQVFETWGTILRQAYWIGFQHTYKGSKLVGFDPVYDILHMFQHTYKGSKPRVLQRDPDARVCSSIPTRVRNS